MGTRLRESGALALALILSVGCAGAQSGKLEVNLENGSEREERTGERLVSLVAEYDVDRWISTRQIRIDENDTPHSHPVLTLHTRHLGDDMRLLSTFLHEQFHWWVIENGRWENKDRAVAEFAELYPDVPSREEGGANNKQSTYLHLVVCDLEFQAMTALLGEEVARELIGGIRVPYPWIYNTLLTDPRIREVNTRHGLLIP